jgi:hypothetical protein
MTASEAARVTALALTRAIATGDAELFDRAAGGIDENVRGWLLVWLSEAISHQYAIFTAADAEGFDVVRLLRVHQALNRHLNARPRIALRAALEPLVRAAR